jgi:2-amino-4-hydroxy-6-hydroxymethyldihydropteridine diphosphokinase
MDRVFLQSGSNLGDRKGYLEFAIRELRNNSTISRVSSIYESDAWGFKSKSAFLNQCIEINTHLKPLELLNFIKETELKAGRKTESENYKDRELDIDILFYGDEIILTKNLEIPHPRLHLRAFTLKPMAEIAPEFIHPVFKESIEELFRKCPDKSNPVIIS